MVKSLFVHITDRVCDSEQRLKTSQRLLQISRVKLDVVIDCSTIYYDEYGCSAEGDLDCHRTALMTVLPKFKCLQTIAMNLYMRPGGHVDECEKDVIKYCPELISALTTVCDPVTFNIFRQGFVDDEFGEWIWKKGATHIMTYCGELKQLQRVVGSNDQKVEKKGTV